MTSTLRAMVRLLRPQQWYKNLLIFLPLIFVSKLFDTTLLPVVMLAFIGLCMISSAGYIFNDIIDRKADGKNPEKKHRPIAAGEISSVFAFVLLFVLLVCGDTLLWWLDWRAGVAGLSMFIMTCCYSLLLKNEAIIDVLALGINFVLRAAIGALVLNVAVSPWLVLCTFFLSLNLSVGKRLSETHMLGTAASAHRASLEGYTQPTALLMLGISSAMLLMSFALYSFLHGPALLMITLPFVIYAVMRHVSLASAGAGSARHPHRLFLDARMMIASVLWGILLIILLYAR